MNAIAKTDERSPSMNSVGMTTGNGTKIAPQNLGEVVRFAEVMARADIALPPHLRGNAGACMAVALQALEWQMSPFAVASKSYAVKGAIAYEAQLIAAVVNTRSGIKGRLKYEFTGIGDAMTCRVVGILDGEECEYVSPPIGTITPKNSPLWKTDPQQQLGYFSARSWARRHVPEVILGVYDREEAETFQGPDNAKNITPVQNSNFDPLSDEPQGGPRERITADGEIVTDEQNTETSDVPHASDAGSDTDLLPGEASTTGPGGSSETSSPDQSSGSEQSEESDHDFDESEWLKSFAKRVTAAIGDDIDQLDAVVSAELVGGLSDDTEGRAGAIVRLAKTACADAENKDKYVQMIAGKAKVEVKDLV